MTLAVALRAKCRDPAHLFYQKKILMSYHLVSPTTIIILQLSSIADLSFLALLHCTKICFGKILSNVKFCALSYLV